MRRFLPPLHHYLLWCARIVPLHVDVPASLARSNAAIPARVVLFLRSMRVTLWSLLVRVGLVVLVCSLGACVNQPSIAGATPPPATAVATATPPTAPPAEAATEPPASPVIYTQVQKLAEGGHDGPRPIDLPAEVVVDSSVTGTCTFDVSFEPEDGSPTTQSRRLEVSGTATDSWDVHLTPGRYLVVLGEAVGCTFLVTVRSPG
jgi:hypothetical protein